MAPVGEQRDAPGDRPDQNASALVASFSGGGGKVGPLRRFPGSPRALRVRIPFVG